MPKSVSPKDRLLSYAFTASVDELREAVSIFTAALKAKSGGAKPATRPTVRRPLNIRASGTHPSVNKVDEGE